MESTTYAQRMAEFGSLMTNALMPFLIIIALLFAFWFAMRYERNYRRSQELEYRRIDNSKTNIMVNSDQPTAGGYDFITVADEFKPAFMDVMNGFSDYARMKGYEVEISFDNSHSGKVGLRVAIVNKGATVSTNTVRDDVQDYIKRFHDNADFSDMPMAQTPAEHSHLVSALAARFSHLKTQIELHRITETHLNFLLDEVRNNRFGGIGYQPINNITLLTNQEASAMRDNYNATNSQNIAQGKGASATTTASHVQIGSNHNERAERIQALKDFVLDAQASDVPNNVKGEVVRYIENAREELETSAEPDGGAIGKWLGRVETTLSAADAGSNLYTKLLPLLALFGLS